MISGSISSIVAVVAEAGVADHDVEPAEAPTCTRDQRNDVGSRVTSIVIASARPPPAANAVDGFVESLSPPRAEHDGDTLRGEPLRHGETDARRCAR